MTLIQKKYRIIEVISTTNWLKFVKHEVRDLYKILDQFGGYFVPPGVLSICFLSKNDMCNVHKKFLSNSILTDVITFEGSEEFNSAGEICVSPDYALEAAKIYNTTFSEELTLYLIHGYLHLAGLNDIEKKEISKMREGERICMNFIKSKKKLPNFRIK